MTDASSAPRVAQGCLGLLSRQAAARPDHLF